MSQPTEQAPESRDRSRRRRNGCILAGFFGGFAVFSLGFGFLIISISRPANSPLSQMYRAESGLTSLITAVETYKADLGAYPPAGNDGLVRAMRHLSEKANYMPQAQALDAWGNVYVYAPAESYALPNSGALQDDAQNYFAPDSFQLYSAGLDGDPGADSIYKRMDNITNWDEDKSWRETYNRRHREFFVKRGTAK